MPISCPSLLTYLQWHRASPSLRSIPSSCLSALRTWLFLHSCCLCLSLCAGSGSKNDTLEIHFPSADMRFNISLHSAGCYLLGSVEGGSQITYDTCPEYGSIHRRSDLNGTIAEPSAFDYALLIAAINQTKGYPNLYNCTNDNVTVSCNVTKCTISCSRNCNVSTTGCSSHHFSFAEDAMLHLAQLYLPPAILLAIALLLAT
uniref:Minor glycoprotein n=1 Tax=Kibale red colobus virus 1 TaxID=1885929 RepID=X2D5A8_9NIDO|nr:minor glycoprotein [Kibale red colobus virus 1]